jgi:quercetin dioxygenase-like cupin family protein
MRQSFGNLATNAVAVLLIAGAVAVSAQPKPAGIMRTDLQRHDLSVSGREVLQARVDFAPGASFPRHRHPGEEIIYVLKGRLEYRLDGQAPIILVPGQVLFVPYGKPHAAVNAGPAPAAELATYVVEKGKPLVIPVP